MRKLSVIIPVKNEEETLEQVIKEVILLNPHEILVIINGSTDNTKYIAKSLGCKVIEYSESLGHDIGRAIGALLATGEILLFVDGDIVIPYQELIPFINAIKDGHDMALNNLEIILESSIRPHSVTVLKKTVNDLFHRSELSLNSLVAVPHAISKKAVNKIGWKNLSVPPLAQAIAMKKGLSIVCPSYVDVISSNKIRPELHIQVESGSPYPPIENIIIGDHLSAINYLIHESGKRGGLEDNRTRELIYNITISERRKSCEKSAIICDDSVGNTDNLIKIIQYLRDAGADEIIVISLDGSGHKRKSVAETGGLFVHLIQDFGAFITRLVGASISSGEIILFTDGNSQLSSLDFCEYFKVIENGVDVALRNTSDLLDQQKPIGLLNSIEFFLNLILKKAELVNHSLINFPHAFHRKVIEKIGTHSLMIPPLAQVKIIQNNFVIKSITTNDQIEEITDSNDIKVLLGDHIEAIGYYLSKTNDRGNFSKGNKNFEVLKEFNDE